MKNLLKILSFTFVVLFSFSLHAQEYQQYTHPRLGFRLQIPSDWKVIQSPQTDLVITFAPSAHLSDASARITMSILNETLPQPKNEVQLKGLVQQVVGPQLKIPGVSDLRVLDSGIKGNKKDNPRFFYKISYGFTPKKEAKKIPMVSLNYFVQEPLDLAFSLVAPSYSYSKYEDVLFHALGSLQDGDSKKQKKKKKKKKKKK